VEQPVTWPPAVTVREVGPRDGIQSEKAMVPTEDKVRLIDALSASGVPEIEAVSFVSPKAIPQMADARDVWQKMTRNPDVFYWALVPNKKGAETAAEVGADGIQVFIAASDSYNIKNVGRHVKDSLPNVADAVEVALSSGMKVQGTISTAFGCPYEGDVAPERVVEVTRWVMDTGIHTISYGDTTGMATPKRVRDLIHALRDSGTDVSMNMHFHDTRGTGLANVVTALEEGIDYLDSSIGGLGGSPYAAGATGNIATEDLVHMLDDMDIETGIDLDRLLTAAAIAQELIEGQLPSKVLRAGPRSRVEGPVTTATTKAD
jgi:hydroxymethylglutaryl-CoA lyase